MYTYRLAQMGTLFLTLLFLNPLAKAAEQWTVTGKIKVAHLMPELKEAFGSSNGLAGIQVRLHARSNVLGAWGTWNSWGVVRTGADGGFRFSEEHGSDRRQFKIEILFDSDALRIKEGQETSIGLNNQGFPIDIDFDLTDKDWHLIHNDEDKGVQDGRKAGLTNLGDVMINRTVVKKHADIWFLYNKIFSKMNSFGNDFSFGKKITLKYPMGVGNNASSSASYCNPLNNNIYLKEDHFNASTATHELFHAWAYFHSTGEDGMVWQLAKHQTTHQARENTTFVAFHEGFAEWASYKVLEEITDGRLKNFIQSSGFDKPHFPLNRNFIGAALSSSERFLANVDCTERGWHSLFNILTYDALGSCNFNESSSTIFALRVENVSCPNAALRYSLKQVLSVFMKNTNQGLNSELKREEMNFGSFLNRAKAILPGFTEEKMKQVKVYLDPNAKENPRDFYCPTIINRVNVGEIPPGALKPKVN